MLQEPDDGKQPHESWPAAVLDCAAGPGAAVPHTLAATACTDVPHRQEIRHGNALRAGPYWRRELQPGQHSFQACQRRQACAHAAPCAAYPLHQLRVSTGPSGHPAACSAMPAHTTNTAGSKCSFRPWTSRDSSSREGGSICLDLVPNMPDISHDVEMGV